MSDSTPKLNAALVAAQSEMRNVPKTAVNPHFRNKYATLDSIVAMARPILNKHGLAVTQAVTTGDVLETIIHHSSGERATVGQMTLRLDKPSMQGLGSAITYARRYSLGAVLGITTDDDDDGNAASPEARPAQPDKPIDDETRKKLIALVNETETDSAKFLAAAKAETFESILSSEVPRLTALLEKKRKAKAAK